MSKAFEWMPFLLGAAGFAGTGGLVGLGMLAWRGLRAAKTAKTVIEKVHEYRHPPTKSSNPPDGGHHYGLDYSKLPPVNMNFVEVPVDYTKVATEWALAKTGERYPGTIAALECVKAKINEHLSAHGHGPETHLK
jgi:hypothetical protein